MLKRLIPSTGRLGTTRLRLDCWGLFSCSESTQADYHGLGSVIVAILLSLTLATCRAGVRWESNGRFRGWIQRVGAPSPQPAVLLLH